MENEVSTCLRRLGLGLISRYTARWGKHSSFCLCSRLPVRRSRRCPARLQPWMFRKLPNAVQEECPPAVWKPRQTEQAVMGTPAWGGQAGLPPPPHRRTP